MIGFLARFIGLWLIAGALVALVVDATRSIATAALVVTPIGEAWRELSLASQMAAQEFVERNIVLGHWLWVYGVVGLLYLPTWVALGAAGLLLTYLGRRRRLKTAYG